MRYTRRQYSIQAAVVTAMYILLIFFEWPMAMRVHPLWARALLAGAPAVPIVVLVGLTARFVLSSDEMQQCIYLIALSVAVGVVSVVSVVGGLLAMAKVWDVGGDVLFWVFPVLCVVFGAARTFTERQVAGTWFRDC